MTEEERKRLAAGLMGAMPNQFGPLTLEQQAMLDRDKINESWSPLDLVGASGAVRSAAGAAVNALRYAPAAVVAGLPALHLVDWDKQEQAQKDRKINVAYPPRPESDAGYYLPPNVGANWLSPESSDMLYRYQGALLHGALALSPIAGKAWRHSLPTTISPNAGYIAFSAGSGRMDPHNNDAESQPGGFYGVKR